MAQFRITVQRVQTGVLYVEANNLDEAFDIAESAEECEYDWDDGYMDTDMMNAEEV